MAKKLLLAEDSLTIQKVFALTFDKSDISLTAVDNGEDAIRLAGEIAPDLVVADVTLPDKSGFEVAAALRSGGGVARSCPILILAGSLPPFDEDTYRKSGADAVLFKPFESQELIDKVEQLLRGGEVPAEPTAEEAGAESAEGWDFSDVLEEVEEEAGKPSSPVPAAAALLPEGDRLTGAEEEPRSLGEFDVSLEEIAGEGKEAGADSFGERSEAEEPVPSEEPVEESADAGLRLEEEELPLIDLAAEDLGIPEPEGEEPLPPETPETPAEIPAEEEPGPEEIEPVAVAATVPEESAEELPADILVPAPFVPPDPEVAELTAAPEGIFVAEALPADEEGTPAEPSAREFARIREEFSDRVRGILESVAAETVEKVMWEMMERLSGEIRQQIREAVEAVAWDVIPATAESLIREEIERIRGKAGE